MTAAQERPCRHCNGADPFCSVCEGVGSLPNLPSEQEREAVVRWLREQSVVYRSRWAISVNPQIDALADAIEAGEHIKETNDG